MSCNLCKEFCNENTRWVCRKDGNFYTTGEYSRTIDYFNIHGVTLNQKIDSVKHLLDSNTIQILKVLIVDIDCPAQFDALTELQIVEALNFIQSRLSTDNKIDNSYHSRGDDE